MIDFPASPTLNQLHTTAGRSWRWNGTVWQGIGSSGGGGVTSYNDLTDKPTIGTAAATNATDYATAAQGVKADTALQASALTSYRTSAAQDVIDSGKASSAQGAKADTALQPGTAISNISGLQSALDAKEPTITTLPVSRGGTGATDATSARTALGITSGIATDVQIFYSSGTWTKPAGAKSVDVLCIAGGGGGGSGRVNAGTNGGGGGAGGGIYNRSGLPASVLGATESVTVGAGGTGGASVNGPNAQGQNGVTGGNSSFGTTTPFVFAGGGGGGTGSAGGAGGSPNGRSVFIGGYAGGGGSAAAGGAAASGSILGAGGGGGGGGCNTTGTFFIGGNGFPSFASVPTGGGQSIGGQTAGSAGGSGHSLNSVIHAGGGGAGGAGNATGNGGAGGNGGLYGGGGGGGGCCGWYPGSGTPAQTYSSGAGGTGANGIVIVTTYF